MLERVRRRLRNLTERVTTLESTTTTGVVGADGADGADGAAGQGVPTGGTTGQVLEKIDATDYNTQWATVAGTGDVVGPASATDNAVTRFDTTTGKLVQNSTVTIDDSGNIVVPGTVDGRDVATDGTKLDTIETNADVTDATNVNAAGAVMESDFTPAFSLIVQQSGTGAPEMLSVGTDTIVGRVTGGGSEIDDLTPATVRTLINVEDGADVTDATNVAAAGATMDSDFGSNGICVRTAAGTYVNRSLSAANGLTVSNADGVSGNPRLDVDLSTAASLEFDTAELQLESDAASPGNLQVYGTDGSGTKGWQGKEYLVPLWAEENAAISTGTFEWAWGNGANTPTNRGIVAYVPTGWSCEIKALSLSINAGTATVEVNLNGTNQGSSANVSVSSGTSATNEYVTGVAVANGDVLNFRTQTASGTSAPCHACMWLRYYT